MSSRLRALSAALFCVLSSPCLAQDDILVADAIADAVVTIDSEGRNHSLIVGSPLAMPRGITVDEKGDILLADERAGVVFRITDGQITTTYGGSLLHAPYGITLDSDGNILVTDTATGNVVRIQVSTRVLSIVCANQLFASPRGLALTLDGRSLVVADNGAGVGNLFRFEIETCTRNLEVPFDNPVGVAVDPDGNYFVSNLTSKNVPQISKVDADSGKSVLVSEAPQFQGLRGLMLSPESRNRLWVADYVASNVFEVDVENGRITHTFRGGSLKGPNDVASLKSPDPPQSSSFTLLPDGTYLWDIIATDLQVKDTPLTLAGFMNQLVHEAGQPQAPNLVLLFTENNDFWWKKVEDVQDQGARITGSFVTSDTFQLSSVEPLDTQIP